MRKFIRRSNRHLKALAEAYADLTEKVKYNSATGDEALAYGCMTAFIAACMFFGFIIVAVICRAIWHLI